MAVLEKSIQDKIESLVDRSYDLHESGDNENSYDLMEEAWALYPDPPENWNESYNTARYAFDDLLSDGELEKATVWHHRMTKVQENLGLWDGSYEFHTGKLYFEKGFYEKAKECFEKAIEIGKGYRYFENQDGKYKEFYLNPEKYL